MQTIKAIFWFICIISFIIAFVTDNIKVSKWFNYFGCAVLAAYVFLIQ